MAWFVFAVFWMREYRAIDFLLFYLCIEAVMLVWSLACPDMSSSIKFYCFC
jgi:hypothetical protein